MISYKFHVTYSILKKCQERSTSGFEGEHFCALIFFFHRVVCVSICLWVGGCGFEFVCVCTCACVDVIAMNCLHILPYLTDPTALELNGI